MFAAYMCVYIYSVCVITKGSQVDYDGFDSMKCPDLATRALFHSGIPAGSLKDKADDFTDPIVTGLFVGNPLAS